MHGQTYPDTYYNSKYHTCANFNWMNNELQVYQFSVSKL